jgi:hypothetical protein
MPMLTITSPAGATDERQSFAMTRIGLFLDKLNSSREIYGIEIHCYGGDLVPGMSC